MKAIIDGKRYDTETAELIAEWSNGLGYSDFKHCEEDLYRTRKGTWFISGAGGPLSSYAVPYGNNGSSGSKAIRPLTAEEARSWLERHRELDALEKYFPDAIEDA